MEASVLNPELLEQRGQIANFIYDQLRPVQDALAEPEADFEVRGYQLDAWQALWEARQTGETSALVTLATGLGKTSVAVFDVIKYREELLAQEGRDPKVLFVCHQDKILEQAAKRFDRYTPDLTRGFYTGEEKNADEDITFATFHSLTRHIDKFDPFEFDYIIYDEAHHSQADTWHKVVKHFNPDFQLALTATPDRMDGLEILDLFGREVYAKGLGEALAEGLLADIDYHIVFDEAVKNALEAGFHPTSLRELRELLDVPRRNDVIAKNIREEMQKIGAEDAKTIVFCNDIAHANIMAKLLGGKAYHSDLKRSERGDILDDFREGDLQIICTRDMFNEGIDIPDANLLVFLRSTQSKTVFEQQLGRGLRKHPGKELVSVLDFVGNIKRLQEVLDLSNAVTALTSEHDLDKLIAEGDRPRGGRGRLNIHTDHTNFDFEKMAIDLLDTYQSLICEPAPEGHVNVSAFARELGVSYSTIKGLIAHHQIETGRHLFGTSVGVSLSPEAQEYIKALDGFLKPAPEGYLSANMFAQEFGIKSATLIAALKGHKLPLERHLYSGHVGISFSPEVQEKVRQIITPVEKAPEGYLSIPDFAAELGIEERLMNRLIRENKVQCERHRFKTKAARSLSPEAQSIIRELDDLGKPIPDDYITAVELSRELGVAHTTIMERARRMGIDITKHRLPQGKLVATFSPEYQQQIREAYPARLREAPEGYMSINEFTRSIGLGDLAVRKAMDENEIDAEFMYFGESRKRGKGLSPEAQALLKQTLKDLMVEPAPEGYVSLPAFAKQLSSSPTKLMETIIMNGIGTERHRFKSQYALSLSPDSQAQIRQIYGQERVRAPEGYVSVTAFSNQAGLGYDKIVQIIEEHDIETEDYVFGVSTVGAGLSPEAQQKILNVRGELVNAPDDYKSVNAIAEETGVQWNTLKKFIAENGIETEQYAYRGSLGTYLGPEAQRQIQAFVKAYAVSELPEGYVTITDFSKEHDLAQVTYYRLAEETGVEPQVYLAGRNRVKGLSPEDQKKLIEAASKTVIPRAPEGYVSLNAFSKELKSSKPTVLEIIEGLGLETSTHRFRSQTSTSLSPETQRQVRQELERIRQDKTD